MTLIFSWLGLRALARVSFIGATTRMIAQAAEVNISAIPYYFNGREGLYHAMVEHICNIIQGQIQAALKKIEKRSKNSPVTPQEAMLLLERLRSCVKKPARV